MIRPIKRYIIQFRHMRTLAKLHDIEQRKSILHSEIDCARREIMRLKGLEAMTWHKLRTM